MAWRHASMNLLENDFVSENSAPGFNTSSMQQQQLACSAIYDMSLCASC